MPLLTQYTDIYSTDIHAGFDARIVHEFNSKWAVYGGMGLQGLGYSRESYDSFQLFIQRTREVYFDIPLGVEFYPGKSGLFSLMLGMNPSILLSKTISQEEQNPELYPIGPDPSKPGRLDFGFSAGVGMHLASGFHVFGSYTQSVSSKVTPAYNSGRNSYFSVGIRYSIFRMSERDKVTAEEEEKGDARHVPGILLVRLKTDHKKIKRYTDAGYLEEAAKLKEKAVEENNSTIEAFREKFTAMPVYYFYDTSSTAIVEKDYWPHLITGTGAALPDSLPLEKVYLAEFGSVYSEAFGTSSGFGLVIYDAKFNQLKEPFPYYTPNFFGLVSRKDVVRKFNNQLIEYFKP